MESWFTQAVEKILETKWYTWAVLVVLVVMGLALLHAGKAKGRWNSRTLAIAAMCVAISFVLSCIRLFRMPQGGSITVVSMLPLTLFCVAFGPLQGLVAGCAYGLLLLIQDMYVIHPLQLLVDYPFAFGAMALSGFVGCLPIKDKLKLPLGVVLATIGRYIMAVISGAVFFAEYAPADQGALVYSLIYNISYLGPDALLCLVVSFLPGVQRLVSVMRTGSRS